MTTDQVDLTWRMARVIQPEIYKALNHVSTLDPAHVRDMDIDRARGMGTWLRATQIADAVIDALPELQDDEPEHGNPFGDVEGWLGPLTIRPGVQRARVWVDGDPEAAREFWQDGRWS